MSSENVNKLISELRENGLKIKLIGRSGTYLLLKTSHLHLEKVKKHLLLKSPSETLRILCVSGTIKTLREKYPSLPLWKKGKYDF